ncbi:DUF1559 family PulG-like putative transporter [Aporhodopirellula aestuarii]|uniref:DUF1559 domain-containing protein n=1 Tax=Aporhodopirellula aestuarii TaxID=2950107 RepID=A0ABT0TXS0_9BACT|nr:DUF1559 domain-containing protein [Aporhodopirellula aestuarii]MCM2369365.1 DUF1559 domain-containing protein [Aporhodopirellula aestuarii]
MKSFSLLQFPHLDRSWVRPRGSRGFSLLEIVVVLGILAILLAISIPVLRDMRTLARRSNCEQNLIRLTLASQAYSVDHLHLPSGTFTGSANVLNGESMPELAGPPRSGGENAQPDAYLTIASLPKGYHHNWISSLLPYCDREGMYQSIHFDVGVYAPQNAVTRDADIPFLRCPSSAERQKLNTSSYVGLHASDARPIGIKNDGMLTLNRWLFPDDVPDGMAYTILLGEKLSPQQFDLGWMSGTRSSLRNAGTPINEPIADEAYHDPAFVGGLASLHAGGAFVALGDGSIEFLSDTIDMKVYQSRVSRNDQANQTDETAE